LLIFPDPDICPSRGHFRYYKKNSLLSILNESLTCPVVGHLFLRPRAKFGDDPDFSVFSG